MANKRRKKTLNIPFELACRYAGGEEELKKALDPKTGLPLFPIDWRESRGRWYGWKSRGVPAYILFPIVVMRLERIENATLLQEANEIVTDVTTAATRNQIDRAQWAQLRDAVRAMLRALRGTG